MIGKKLLSIAIILTISLLIHATGGIDELIDNVNRHIKEGQPKKALKLLESQISQDEENCTLLTKRAEIYRLLDRRDEARTEVQNILRRNPAFPPALLIAASLCKERKEFNKALDHIDIAFDSRPSQDMLMTLFALKGSILLRMGEFENAEENLMIACSDDLVSLSTMCDLAKALSNNDKMDEAIVVLESSIERFGIQMNSLVLAGNIENKRGNHDDAINYLDLALSLDGENPTALAALAEAYMYIDDLEMAELKLKKALESKENSAYAHKVYGDLFMKNGDKRSACGAYNLAVENGFADDYGQVEILFLLNESCELD